MSLRGCALFASGKDVTFSGFQKFSILPVLTSLATLLVLASLFVVVIEWELGTFADPGTIVALCSALFLSALIPFLFRHHLRRVLDERTSSIRQDNRRLESQRQAILRLANSKMIFGADLKGAFRELTEIAAETLAVERVSIWTFDATQSAIRCECQFERTARLYSHGQECRAVDAPRYFSEIRRNRVIVADDVAVNPCTSEFPHLREAGVTSMLDAPIFVNGAMFGIVCHEHVGPMRRWTVDEQNFASSVADMVAMAIEVHERRKVEGELRRKSRALEASFEGIALIERSEVFSFVNPAFARMFGYTSPSELVGCSWRVLYEAAQLRKLERHVFISFMRAGNLQCEAVGLRRDGTTFAQELSLTALGDGGLVCIVRDITQRKEAESQLIESRKFLRKVIDTDPNFIFVKDEAGRFALVNQAVAEAYGTSVERLIGRTDADFNPDTAQVESFLRDDRHVITTGHEIVIQEEKITDAKGRERYLQTVKRPLFIPGRPGVHVLGVSAEITQQKNLREQLVQSQKMEALGQLAGGIAHDFNNLMTGVLGYTTLIKLDSSDRPDVYRSAEVIEQAALRAAELTQKLLGFARRGKHQNTPVDMHRMVEETLAIIARTIEPTITVSTSLKAKNTFVRGDPGQLQQIILNLAINARDAMDPDIGGTQGGQLSIETCDEAATSGGAESSEFLRLVVRDTGCGISEAIKGRIFEPFFTTKEESRGSGLGLSMVYGIVCNHGGTVSLESREGQGTAFTIRLPVVHVPLEERVEASVQITARGKGRILVVDDHEVVRAATSDMLQSLGYEVIVAKDGVDAIELFRTGKEDIDLVVIDVIMPRMGAAECLAAMRAMKPDVRAVISTGYAQSFALSRLLESEGVVGFISKPFQLARLSKVVSEAMQKAVGTPRPDVALLNPVPARSIED